MLENSAWGLRSRREHCWGYISIYKNTPKKLPHLPPKSWNNLTWWFEEGHNWSIAKVALLRLVLRLHANTSSPGIYWREQPEPFGTMPQEVWYPGKGAKPDCIVQLNCREVCTHASYKTTRIWANFNNGGAKMFLLSVKLWLIANNSKSFVTGVIRINLGLHKCSEIYLI